MSKKSRDITGERFGLLVAQTRVPGSAPSLWVCRCDCGVVFETRLCRLVGGQSKSCGCFSRDTFNRYNSAKRSA